jgi:hypothetical protein
MGTPSASGYAIAPNYRAFQPSPLVSAIGQLGYDKKSGVMGNLARMDLPGLMENDQTNQMAYLRAVNDADMQRQRMASRASNFSSLSEVMKQAMQHPELDMDWVRNYMRANNPESGMEVPELTPNMQERTDAGLAKLEGQGLEGYGKAIDTMRQGGQAAPLVPPPSIRRLLSGTPRQVDPTSVQVANSKPEKGPKWKLTSRDYNSATGAGTSVDVPDDQIEQFLKNPRNRALLTDRDSQFNSEPAPVPPGTSVVPQPSATPQQGQQQQPDPNRRPANAPTNIDRNIPGDLMPTHNRMAAALAQHGLKPGVTQPLNDGSVSVTFTDMTGKPKRVIRYAKENGVWVPHNEKQY